ncbi:TPA: hypothetical protein DDW35_06470 [Candidatus Sumerlaeota bacterium]|nr:hypothetical protein [Candidatus Sumerlaeota bacterium]
MVFVWGAAFAVSDDNPTTGTLVITQAVYGKFPNGGQVDVTKKVAAMVTDGYLRVRASNDYFGDPAFPFIKKLRVNYTLDGKPASVTIDEEQTLILGTKPPVPSRNLFVTKAIYGKFPSGEQIDITRCLDDWVEGDRLDVEVSDTNFGKFKSNIARKQLRVEYLLNGVKKVKTLGEGQRLEIPEECLGK